MGLPYVAYTDHNLHHTALKQLVCSLWDPSHKNRGIMCTLITSFEADMERTLRPININRGYSSYCREYNEVYHTFPFHRFLREHEIALRKQGLSMISGNGKRSTKQMFLRRSK